MILAMATVETGYVAWRLCEGHVRRCGIRSWPQVCLAEIRVAANREGEMLSGKSCSIWPIIGVADTAGQLVVTFVMAACAIWHHISGWRGSMTRGTGTDGIPGRISYMAVETIEADIADRPRQTRMTQATGRINGSGIITGGIVVGYK